MGAHLVKSHHELRERKKSSERMRNSVEAEPVKFVTDHQKVLLKDSWEVLKDDMSKVGVVAFMKLFETHPDVQDAFLPFRGLSTTDMEQSAILRAHALRVMMTVEKCLNRIENPAKIEGLMAELGHRHGNYNAKSEYIDMMGEQFIYALKTNLDDKWTPELERAWVALFNIMKYYMRRGLSEATKGQ